MRDALLLLPDLLLIACGYAICRFTPLNRPVWDGAERLVYYLLFPVLLFNSIVRNPLQPGHVWQLALSAQLVMGTGVVLAYAMRRWAADKLAHASGAQIAFRFNSYVLLALSERLAGSQGVAWAAVIVAVCVPLANVAAVWPLARHGGHGYWAELRRNPLILSTVAGLVCNLLGLRLPEFMETAFARIGAAALPLGLMAVGAGLRLGGLQVAPRLGVALLAVKHAVLPLAGLALALFWPLPAAQQALLVTFAAMPTASSAYVLAVRMGGHGPYVAALVTISTLVAMVGMPLTMLLLRAVSRT